MQVIESKLLASVTTAHPDLRYGHAVDKTPGGTNWNYLCKGCKHSAVSGDRMPCTACWNPPGDMFEPAETP